MLGRMMMNSDVKLAEEVLKGIALIEDAAKNPDPVVEAKDKEIDELDKEFEDALGKLVNIEQKSTANNDLMRVFHWHELCFFLNSRVLSLTKCLNVHKVKMPS